MHFPREAEITGVGGAGSQGKPGRLVCTGCISSGWWGEFCFIYRYVFKGDSGCRVSCASGMNRPPWELEWRGKCLRELFPRGWF